MPQATQNFPIILIKFESKLETKYQIQYTYVWTNSYWMRRYLEDFANCTNSETSITDYAEEVLRNPLLKFKLIRRIVHFFRLQKQKHIPGGYFILHSSMVLLIKFPVACTF